MSTKNTIGTHKISSNWNTPTYIWDKIYAVLGREVKDPCPPGGSGGLEMDWGVGNWYINPPSPAAVWAEKAIITLRENHSTSIIFAAFSPNVLFQVPLLQCYPHVKFRKRIKWIASDGRPSNPVTYNTFICLSHSDDIVTKFGEEFRNLGCYGILQLL